MSTLLQPSDVVDQGATLFSQLGSFWTTYYDSASTVRDYCRGLNEAVLQTREDTLEAAAAVSRFQIPIYHRVRWYPLTLLKSARLPDVRLTYTSADNLGPTASTFLNGQTFDYTLPTDFIDVGFILDDPINPQVILVKNAHYAIDGQTISFRDNPFNQFTNRDVFTGSVVTDEQVTLWCGQVDFDDRKYIANQFGYVLKLELESSQNYKDLLNATWDAALNGPSRDTLDRSLSAICDAPIAKANETVVDIVTESNRKLVITDQSVYIIGVSATIIVAIGQVLSTGDYLTSAFKVIDLSQGTPTPDQLSVLYMTTDYLKGPFSGSIGFENVNTPLQVTTVAGRTFVSFALLAAVSDAALFFNLAFDNALTTGAKTLAQLLDTRPVAQQVGDPDVNSLPSLINPLDFLIKNILRYG